MNAQNKPDLAQFLKTLSLLKKINITTRLFERKNLPYYTIKSMQISDATALLHAVFDDGTVNVPRKSFISETVYGIAMKDSASHRGFLKDLKLHNMPIAWVTCAEKDTINVVLVFLPEWMDKTLYYNYVQSELGILNMPPN